MSSPVDSPDDAAYEMSDTRVPDSVLFECPTIKQRYTAVTGLSTEPLDVVATADRYLVRDIIRVCLSFPRHRRPFEPEYDQPDDLSRGDMGDDGDLDVAWTINPHRDRHYYDLLFKYTPRTFIPIAALNRIIQIAPGSIDTTHTGILNDARTRQPVVRVRALMYPMRCHTESTTVILQSPPVFYIASQTESPSLAGGAFNRPVTDDDDSVSVVNPKRKRSDDPMANVLSEYGTGKRPRVHIVSASTSSKGTH